MNVYLKEEVKDDFILYKYLRKGINLQNNFENMEQDLVDEIMQEFIGCYCDFEEGQHLLKIIGPLLSKWRYYKSTKIVLETNDKEFIKLWNFIIKGRSLKNIDNNFNGYTNEFKTGFLSEFEYKKLEEKIVYYFEKIKIINDNKTRVDNDYSGLSYVLEAIKEMEFGNEMITAIEC